jgi:hypothetical protein
MKRCPLKAPDSMTLIGDVRESFRAKDLEFVSLTDAGNNRSRLTYKDGSKLMTKEFEMPLSELEETVEELDIMDPDDLAEYLLKPQ